MTDQEQTQQRRHELAKTTATIRKAFQLFMEVSATDILEGNHADGSEPFDLAVYITFERLCGLGLVRRAPRFDFASHDTMRYQLTDRAAKGGDPCNT